MRSSSNGRRREQRLNSASTLRGKIQLEKVGVRLAELEAEHYRSEFQLADSRIAGLLLRLADEQFTVLGLSHQQIGEMLGMYRETVTAILDSLKAEKLIEVSRKRIKILEKRALQELAEL
jgi:CRP-like cAMP-binding protein